MDLGAGTTDARTELEDDRQPILTGDTRRHLGIELRSVYEGSCDVEPIPDVQIDLLLRLRHKERDLRRAG